MPDVMERITDYTPGMSYERCLNDRKTIDAVFGTRKRLVTPLIEFPSSYDHGR